MFKFGYLILALAFPIGALAQATAPVVRSGTFEVGGFLGSSYGVDSYRVMGGGNVTYGITKPILAYAEYSYFPGIQRQIDGTIGGTANPYKAFYSVPISDFHGGVHIRILHGSRSYIPYGVIGVGGLTRSDFSYAIKYQDPNGIHSVQLSVPGDTAVALNFGGGLRYYLGKQARYGLRVEAKIYKPYGDKATGYTDPFMKAEVGFFIQLR